jgi:c(7)-type cytochrome triheme protein
MRRSIAPRWIVRGALAVLAIIALAAVAAGSIRSLAAETALGPPPGNRPGQMPGVATIAQSADSPGRVTFDHASHVDAGRPDCTACHPRLFSILEDRSADRTIRHARMAKQEQCGACHDGKTAFGLDECTLCHHVE